MFLNPKYPRRSTCGKLTLIKSQNTYLEGRWPTQLTHCEFYHASCHKKRRKIILLYLFPFQFQVPHTQLEVYVNLVLQSFLKTKFHISTGEMGQQQKDQ